MQRAATQVRGGLVKGRKRPQAPGLGGKSRGHAPPPPPPRYPPTSQPMSGHTGTEGLQGTLCNPPPPPPPPPRLTCRGKEVGLADAQQKADALCGGHPATAANPGDWRGGTQCPVCLLQLAPTAPAKPVFVAFSSVCQFQCAAVCCPGVQWRGVRTRALPPLHWVTRRLLSQRMQTFGMADWGVGGSVP